MKNAGTNILLMLLIAVIDKGSIATLMYILIVLTILYIPFSVKNNKRKNHEKSNYTDVDVIARNINR